MLNSLKANSILVFALLSLKIQLYAPHKGLILDQIHLQPIIGAFILGKDTVRTNDQVIFYYHPGYKILNFTPFAHLASQVYDQPCRRVLHYE